MDWLKNRIHIYIYKERISELSVELKKLQNTAPRDKEMEHIIVYTTLQHI